MAYSKIIAKTLNLGMKFKTSHVLSLIIIFDTNLYNVLDLSTTILIPIINLKATA
jgi:hypothetical protein